MEQFTYEYLDNSSSKGKPLESFSTNNDITKEDITNMIKKIWDESHVQHLLILVVVYILVYILFGYVMQSNGNTQTDAFLSSAFDYVSAFAILAFFLSFLYSGNYTIASFIQLCIQWTIDFYETPTSIFSTFTFLLVFYIIITVLRIPTTPELKPYTVHIIESKVWILIASILIYDVFKYVFHLDMLDIFKNPTIEKVWKTKTDATTTSTGNEVYNIANNQFTYEDAQALCTAFDSRLATYDEIEKTYEDGGEWCNYGWSEGQMVFFPTQKSTWDWLQKKDGEKNKCGRPGINGGYVPNKKMSFGINCFGKKPSPKDIDLAIMETNRALMDVVPVTAENQALVNKVNYWRENGGNVVVNSFNLKKWSYY